MVGVWSKIGVEGAGTAMRARRCAPGRVGASPPRGGPGEGHTRFSLRAPPKRDLTGGADFLSLRMYDPCSPSMGHRRRPWSDVLRARPFARPHSNPTGLEPTAYLLPP